MDGCGTRALDPAFALALAALAGCTGTYTTGDGGEEGDGTLHDVAADRELDAEGRDGDGEEGPDAEADDAGQEPPPDDGPGEDPAGCGDGACGAGEDCSTCPADCGPCLPTCGGAGGNTCTDAGTTLCEDLPLIPSSDCAVCCARRALPAVGPNSYHIIVRADTDRWDGIVGLMDRGAVLCSENRPDSIPPDRWCRKISSDYMDAAGIVDTIHHAFQTDAEQPARVMIDELEVLWIDKIAQVASTMRTRYPQYAGLWGVFIENTGAGDASRYYGPKESAINELLLAGAILAAEMYVGRGAYCNCGGGCPGSATYGQRDIRLADWFRGDLGTWKKFAWLARQKADLGSPSQLSVVFGVTDDMVGSSDAYIYIDRLFYVWVTRSEFAGILQWTNGGAGAYKWEAAAVSSSNRDNLFADSFNHYCFGAVDSRFPGPAFCD